MKKLRVGSLAAMLTAFACVGCASAPDPAPTVEPLVIAPVSGETHEGTLDEWSTAMVACLRDAGWDASIPPGTPAGGLSSGHVPPEQDDQYREDVDYCLRVKVGEWVEIRDEQDLRARYDALGAQFSCLGAAGFDVPEPPSYETFRDAFNSTGTTLSYYPPGCTAG
ncbi:hypothetical protein [Agrococcus beijingensis]|uniref:hypothetical protein n=1 Tax=Agrococcus beijingensis TaxID=3068634 RepID=UPI00274266D4|nr:hypothetical protein [Agrococcus sp. REN33]